MNRDASKRLVIMAFAGSVMLGCGRNSQLPGWGVHVVEWSEWRADVEFVDGIDKAAVHFGTLGDANAVVIWSDRGGSVGASWDRDRKAVEYEGRYSTRGGREYRVTCHTPDGKSGPVTIGGQTFDLEDGKLFLIATPGDTVTVKQLRRDNIKPDKGLLREAAETDAEIKEFFATVGTASTSDIAPEP